jgi:hypothetical protein
MQDMLYPMEGNHTEGWVLTRCPHWLVCHWAKPLASVFLLCANPIGPQLSFHL